MSVSQTSQILKLTPDFIQKLAETVSALFYDKAFNKNNPTHNSKRMDIIIMIRNICCNSSRHLKIDHSNIDCFTKILESQGETLDVSNDCDDNVSSTDLDIMSSLIDFNRIYLQTTEIKMDLLNHIKRRDKEKYIDPSFDPMFISTLHSELTTNCATLQLLNNQASCIMPTDNVKKQEETANISQEHIRIKYLNVAYGCLNLVKINGEMYMLYNILDKMAKYSVLNFEEVEFIEYLWQNAEELSLPNKMLINILESFKFIYEKCLLKLCTSIIEEEPPDKILLDNYKKIVKVGLENKTVYTNILNCVYEIYSISNYNSAILNLITNF